MPRLYSEPIQRYQEWSKAPTQHPTLDRLISPFLQPQLGVGASPIGMVGEGPGPLAALLARAGRVFHGTGEAFDQFSPAMTRHPGYWFSSAPEEAAKYATGVAPNMRSVSLRITNPAPPELYAKVLGTLQSQSPGLAPAQLHAAVGVALAKEGFDSVAVPGLGGATQFAVFDPAKIGLPNLTGVK